MVRIAQILSGTIADELDLQIGSRIIRINGAAVRDTVDFRFMEADERLELEVLPPCGGGSFVFEIEKDAGEALGVVPAQDVVRECANKCVFCFIDGNPSGVRRSLYLRDDDFRLSFTYGSYVTLTNLGPRGFQRLIDQRLSPLYVSVHATERDVRMRLLGVPRGGDILDQLRRLTSAGIDVHTQVVLCPGWNDGPHLDRTIADLWDLGERVLSLSVVPVGLTRYNLNRPVRMLTAAEAAAAVAQVEAARPRAVAGRGSGWIYAADELYLQAGLPLPDSSYYDDWPLTENGVGAVRRLLDEFEAGLPLVRERCGASIAVVTGTRMAPILEPLASRLANATGAAIDVIGVENRLFGATVTTAGLLPGADIAAAVAARGEYDVILLSAEALNDDEVFIDDLPFSELCSRLAPTRVLPGYELIGALSMP